MKRGFLNPDAYSSTENPAGVVNFASAGLATTLGPFATDGVAKGGGSLA
jgi:hypothetical protein